MTKIEDRSKPIILSSWVWHDGEGNYCLTTEPHSPGDGWTPVEKFEADTSGEVHEISLEIIGRHQELHPRG